MPSDLTIYRDGETLLTSRRAYERIYRDKGWRDHPEAPARSARKGEWVDFAVQYGDMQPEDAERLTRDELADQFTEPSPSSDDDQTGPEPENKET